MAKLIYFTQASLDGYIGDGRYDWAMPSEEVFAFINDLMRPAGTYLYGRRMYETMSVWETPEGIPDLQPVSQEFARIWKAAEKVVYSRSRESVSTARTRLEREFLPEAVREMKAQSQQDILVGGPTLAAEAIGMGLVDEYYVLVVPAMLGGGIRILPDGVQMRLELLDQRRFDNGTVYLRYGQH